MPEIRGNEWAYVKECLDTNWVSSAGQFVDRFESMVAGYVGTKHAVATVNGTAALHVALLVAGVEPDDEVLVSTLSFIAPANAIRYIGAWPVFIDVEPDYWQMDSSKVETFLSEQCEWRDGTAYNRNTGRRVKAILPVHILGHPCDMTPILDLARAYNLKVIEDATESLGATYKGTKVGRLGDVSCFSFNGNKLITTGGGGMIVTDDDELAHKARYLTTQAKNDPVEYVHEEIGFNYRLTNVLAAMGCAQMEQIHEYVSAKQRIAEIYREGLSDLPGIAHMAEAPWASSAHWMYTILVDEAEFGMDRRTLLGALTRNQIQTRPLWEPLHRSGAHRGSWQSEMEWADVIHAKALSLPCSVGLTSAHQSEVMNAIKACAE